jgi:2-phosphoglycerate kinase
VTPVREDRAVARLILLNGPPGIGKSTLAQRYVDDHPLALNLDIDSVRRLLGRDDARDRFARRARSRPSISSYSLGWKRCQRPKWSRSRINRSTLELCP